jgi:hypothetical protein
MLMESNRLEDLAGIRRQSREWAQREQRRKTGRAGRVVGGN